MPPDFRRAAVASVRDRVSVQLPTPTAARISLQFRLELADLLVSQIHRADNLMVDPEQAADATIERNAARHPADRCGGTGGERAPGVSPFRRGRPGRFDP